MAWTATTRWTKRTRCWVALGVLVVVCAALGWWWWSRQPKALVVMAEFEGSAISSFDTGFLTQHDADITAYNWDGAKLWTVRDADADPAISPNGRFLATLVTHEKTRVITCWEHGRRLWQTTLTAPTGRWSDMGGGVVYVANDGRVLATWTDMDWMHRFSGPKTTFYRLFDHGRCVAHGSIAHGFFAHDVSTFDRLYGDGGYYTWTLKQQALVFDLHKVKLNWVRSTDARWQDQSWPDKFLLQSDNRSAPHHLPMRVIGIASPPTMHMTVPTTNCSGAVSSNGRYAVLVYEHELPPKLQWLQKQIPFLNHSSHVMAVYEQPGQLRALATWDDNTDIRIHGHRLDGFLDPSSCLVSPQGHRLVLNINYFDEEFRTYLLRW